MTGLPTRFKLTGKLLILLLVSLTTILAACGGGVYHCPIDACCDTLKYSAC